MPWSLQHAQEPACAQHPPGHTVARLRLLPSDRTECSQEYYSNILKKLKNVGASSKQTDFYV